MGAGGKAVFATFSSHLDLSPTSWFCCCSWKDLLLAHTPFALSEFSSFSYVLGRGVYGCGKGRKAKKKKKKQEKKLSKSILDFLSFHTFFFHRHYYFIYFSSILHGKARMDKYSRTQSMNNDFLGRQRRLGEGWCFEFFSILLPRERSKDGKGIQQRRRRVLCNSCFFLFPRSNPGESAAAATAAF